MVGRLRSHKAGADGPIRRGLRRNRGFPGEPRALSPGYFGVHGSTG